MIKNYGTAVDLGRLFFIYFRNAELIFAGFPFFIIVLLSMVAL